MSTTITSDQVLHAVTFAWTGTAHASESVQYVDGVETRRNLVRNPNIETNATGYAAANGSTIAVDTTRAHTGTRSLKVSAAAGALFNAQLNGYGAAFVPGNSHTLTYWAKIDTDLSVPIQSHVYFYGPSGAVIGEAIAPTPLQFATDWTLVSVSFVVPEGTTGASIVFAEAVGNAPSTATDTVWFDSFLLETGLDVQPYFDGATEPYPIYGSSTPLLIDGWEESSETRNVVNTIVGGGVDYTLYPAGLRSGQFVAVFEDEDDAATLVRMHQQPARFTIADPDRPSVAMLYIANGTISRALDDESRDYWLVTVPFQEVDA